MEERKNNKVIDLNAAKSDSERTFHSKYGNYRPDDDLLQSTARIKSQRDVIRDRIATMEASAEKVTKSVFDKVQRDYALQLQTISELLDEKKDTLKKEIKDLYLRREKLSVEINRHKEILEEAEFRHHLGEFSQSQFQEVENFETKEIEKLETDLTRISQFIHSHEELFDPEDLGIKPQPKEEVTKTVAKEEPKPQEQPVPQQTAPIDQEEESITAPKPAPQEAQPQQSTESSEFEDLFLDDEEPEEEKKLAESQSDINKLVDNGPSGGDNKTAVKEKQKEEQDDYFSQEKVNEDSFTVKKETAFVKNTLVNFSTIDIDTIRAFEVDDDVLIVIHIDGCVLARNFGGFKNNIVGWGTSDGGVFFEWKFRLLVFPFGQREDVIAGE